MEYAERYEEIHQRADNDRWYFWDEEEQEQGPFRTYEEAEHGLNLYYRQVVFAW